MLFPFCRGGTNGGCKGHCTGYGTKADCPPLIVIAVQCCSDGLAGAVQACADRIADVTAPIEPMGARA